MPFFSKVFKRDATATKGKGQAVQVQAAPPRPRWEEAWSRQEVAPEEVVELIHQCTQEMKSRALDMPFLLLPFRPGSDPVGSKSFVRNFFRLQYEGSWQENRHVFEQELMLMDPLVLCSVMKWCWSRLSGGVVTWETYDLFKQGEIDSKMSKTAFSVFIPMATDSDARKSIVFDFFDLLAAIAARGKYNGLGGRKLSRMAGWWAFEHSDHGKGFDGGYNSWARAADATSHLFFAYLRSLSPHDAGALGGISQLPRSLEALLSQTEYPPEAPTLMFARTPKVVMIVKEVSPTPFSLLRRARNFEFRDDIAGLQEFSEFEDPVQALTDECRRVIGCVSNVNESVSPSKSNAVPADGAWSRFEDLGFDNLAADPQSPGDLATSTNGAGGLRNQAASNVDDLGRPTTPSWADFLSTGFPAERGPMLLPPDKSLPLPVKQPDRAHSSQIQAQNGDYFDGLEAGELASVNQFDLDETFWWVWMTSLAGEETPLRKAVFGRCALIETQIRGAHWLVIEEQIQGASPDQNQGVYIAEKKSRFGWTRRARLGRKKSVMKKAPQPVDDHLDSRSGTPSSRLAPDQHLKVREAAERLKDQDSPPQAKKRARLDEATSMKTNSVMTLQTGILNEAGPAMKWANTFDRDRGAIRSAYLQDSSMGKGEATNGTSVPKTERNLPDLPGEPNAEHVPAMVQQSTHPDGVESPDTVLESQPDLEKPRLDEVEQHPAERTRGSSSNQNTPSPESRSSKKGPKRNAVPTGHSGGGFKKLFGRKKAQDPPPPPKPSSPIKLHKTSPKHAKSVPISVPHGNEPTAEPAAFEHGPSEAVARGVSSDYPTPGNISEREDMDADQEFSRFDQGPADVPADVDKDLPTGPVPAPQEVATPVISEPAAGPPTPPKEATEVLTSKSELEPAAAATEQESPAPDRWAQIRKNAAARAERMNAQHQNSRAAGQGGKTDSAADGDVGEETIEARVARIKARVAELTGNMESPSRVPVSTSR